MRSTIRKRNRGDILAMLLARLPPSPMGWRQPPGEQSRPAAPSDAALPAGSLGGRRRCWLAWKTHLAADRTSCPKATANQFRLFLHAGACWLLWSLRAR